MTALAVALLGAELIAYFALLTHLAHVTKALRPDLFAAVGGLSTTDYLTLGFGPGDAFISKLESRRAEFASESRIIRLMKVARASYIGVMVTIGASIFIIVNHAN